jgi:hypothetical protein
MTKIYNGVGIGARHGADNGVFTDAEHLWFWFMSGRRIKSGFGQRGDDRFRPCELLDVELLITRMYFSGRLSGGELRVLKKYGEARRAPNQFAFGENRDAMIWAEAMRAIARAARTRGWLE